MVYKVNFVTTSSLSHIEKKLERLNESFNVIPVDIQYDITGMTYSRNAIKSVTFYIVCDKVEKIEIGKIREMFESYKEEN